jgi:hypothetical protein
MVFDEFPCRGHDPLVLTGISIKENVVFIGNLHHIHNINSVSFLFTAKPGKPEGPLEVSDVHRDGCKLKWKKPKDDGGEPIDAYVVEKYDPDTGIWLPVGRTKDPELEVQGLIPGHEYQFRVKAVNKEGESEPLETLSSIVAKDPFSK